MPGVVDADTHIMEPGSMFELMSEEQYNRRPVLVRVPSDTVYKGFNAFWLIDGDIFPKPAGKGGFPLATPTAAEIIQNRNQDISIGSMEITDVADRLKDMDELGVDVQIVYPTLFLVCLTQDVKLEIELCRAYNRFMGNAWSESNNRINWVLMPPLRDVDAAIEEMRYGKEHGAVGVFFRALEVDMSLAEPYFFPIYAEAARLNLPISIHTGAGSPAITNIFNYDISFTFPTIRIQPLLAFRDIVANRVPEKFPGLRFGFLEAEASWVPYVLHNLGRFFKLIKDDTRKGGIKLFEEYGLYVACEADEDVNYLLDYIGEDHMMIGSDYGHNDQSFEDNMARVFRGREDVPGPAIEKILDDNARAFYALDK